MQITAARTLYRRLKEFADSHADKAPSRWKPTDGVLSGFHHWAASRPALGAFLFVAGPNQRRLWVAVIDWRQSDEWYVVLFPESRSGPLAELHRVASTPDGPALHWKYKPCKGDGRNSERTEYFSKHFRGCDVFIRIPQAVSEVEDFCDDLESLVSARSSADSLNPGAQTPVDSFPEGRLVERLHLARERNPALIRRAKELAPRPLVCACCGFDFEAKYGLIGRDFIEAHHTKPVSTFSPDGDETLVEDIALVCSNCHRMLHRRRPWLGIHELKDIVGNG